MSEEGLPKRLFRMGFEPEGIRRINNYFNLRWIDIIRDALEDEHIQMLEDSQFRSIMQMGNHTFSVMFVHYLLSRQLVTEKEYELWWLYAGKPIRFAIQDFALVTGLNCAPCLTNGKGIREPTLGKRKGYGKTKDPALWTTLFGKEQNPTTDWVFEKLMLGKKYKEPLTRFRLALLLLVEGIVCPTCKGGVIRSETIEMVGNVEQFLKYLWGRESFLLTVTTAKARNPAQYAQPSTAIKGFAHAVILVTVTCCPEIIVKRGSCDRILGPNIQIQEIIQSVVERKLCVGFTHAKTVDKKGQAEVRSLLCDGMDDAYDGIGFADEVADESVDTIVEMIRDEYQFEHNVWEGGVKAVDVEKKKKVAAHVSDEEESMDGDGNDNCADSENSRSSQYVGGGKNGDDENIEQVSIDESEAEGKKEPMCRGGSGRPGSDSIDLIIRKVADAFEERALGMYEGLTVSLKEHFEKLLELQKIELVDKMSEIGKAGVCGKCNTKIVDDGLSELGKDTGGEAEGKVKNGEAEIGGKSRAPVGGPKSKPSPSDNNNGGGNGGRPHLPKDGKHAEVSKQGVECEHSGPVGGRFEGEVKESSGTGNNKGHTDAPPTDESCDVPDKVFKECSAPPAEKIEKCGGKEDAMYRKRYTRLEKPTFFIGLTQMSTEGREGEEMKGGQSEEKKNLKRKKKSAAVKNSDGEDSDSDDIPIAFRHRKQQRTAPKKETSKSRYSRQARGSKDVNVSKEDDVRNSDAANSSVDETSPKDCIGSLIGGFHPMERHPPNRRRALIKLLERKKTDLIGQALEIENTSFLNIMNGTCLLAEEDVDMLVKFIQRRRDQQPTNRFDFLPLDYLHELKRQYKQFCVANPKETFNFADISPPLFRRRPVWYAEVDFLYCPIHIELKHWIGAIVDLKQWAIYVVDSNMACLTEEEVEKEVEFLSVMLPFVICKNCVEADVNDLNEAAFRISRMDLEFGCESPGLAAVSALLLLELHAVGGLLRCVHLNHTNVHLAAENYAFASFLSFNPTIVLP